MIDNLLDGLKGIGKLIGFLFYIIGYIPYKAGEFLLKIKLNSEIQLEKSKVEIKKPVRKRAPRKKKVVEAVTTEVNKSIN